MKRMLCYICLLCLVCSVFSATVSGEGTTPSLAIDPLEDQLLGSVSKTYESNGNPGLISSGNGDLGGASYGAYQFASKMDIPLTFAKWCVSSQFGVETGNRLVAAYEKDGQTFGTGFNAEWTAIATEDADGFLRLQRLYTREKYYVPAVGKLMEHFDLDVNMYGIAFKNAVWSRTLQHGLGSYNNRTGFLGIMRRVVDERLPSGLHTSSEAQLITAIYEESGAVVDEGTKPMLESEAGGNAWIIRKYDLDGKYMKYYSGNSAAVQAGVYLRLRVNEIKDLLAMLETYGGYEGGGNYGSTAPFVGGDTLNLSLCDTLQGWSDNPTTQLTIDKSTKKQGSGALKLTPLRLDYAPRATLQFDSLVNLSGFTELTVQLFVPVAQTQPDSGFVVNVLSAGNKVFSGEWPLISMQSGWQTIRLALPAGDKLLQVDGIEIAFTNVAGDWFVIDQLIAVANVPSQTMKQALVDVDDVLNCRKGPSATYDTVGQFAGNTNLTVMGQDSKGWYFCSGRTTEGSTVVGWCSGDYLILSNYATPEGDVDSDHKVTATDALQILRCVVGKQTFTDDQKIKADVDMDGEVTANDALEVLKIVVNKR